MTIWLTILGMGLITLATRTAALLLMRAEPAPWLRRWLDFVPPAVFTALIIPALLVAEREGGRALMIGPSLPAGLVGALVAWRSGSVVATIAAGLLAFWAARWLGM